MFRFKSTVSSVGKVGIQGSFLLSLRRAAWWGEGILAQSPPWQGRHGNREGGSWLCCLCHREPESDEGPCPAHFVLPLSETLAHGMGQPVLRAGLPTPISQTDFPSQIGPGVWGPSVLTLAFFSCQPGGGSWKGKINVIVLTKVSAD